MSYEDGYQAGHAAGVAGQIGECFDDPDYDAGYQAGYQAGLAEQNTYTGPTIGPLSPEQAQEDDKSYEDYLEQQRELYHMIGETPPEEIEHMHPGGNNPEVEPAEAAD